MRLSTSVLCSGLLFAFNLGAQNHGNSAYQVPEDLARGAAFKDLFLHQSLQGALTNDLWGTPGVLPRDPANGIEDTQVVLLGRERHFGRQWPGTHVRLPVARVIGEGTF